MREIIRQIAQVINENFNPEKVILFGSYAYGKPTAESDIDIFVIMDTKLRFSEQATEIRMKIREKIKDKPPIDLLVRTQESIKKRIEMNDFFIKEIIEKGVVL